ncbi:MAG: hypothetical protein IKZ78_01330, partial [Firmicutes bacterium]|nr:hypothetical protein [Bacillota bacterium]
MRQSAERLSAACERPHAHHQQRRLRRKRLDTQKLERRFAARDFRPGCEADERDKNLFLRLPDGSVWQIKRRKITVGKKDMDETIAYDVTRRYFDMLDLE